MLSKRFALEHRYWRELLECVSPSVFTCFDSLKNYSLLWLVQICQTWLRRKLTCPHIKKEPTGKCACWT